MIRFVAFVFALSMLSIDHVSAVESSESPVASFTLDNGYGKPVSIADYADRRGIVVAFLGTECPLARLYGPRLNEIQERFADQGIAVIGINSNTQDSMTELLSYVHRHEIQFPVLKDVGNRVADQFAATRTPEVFLLDADRVIRYRGRIDDQYGIGYARNEPTQNDLAIAIEQLLGDQPVEPARTDAVGCHIGRVKKSQSIGTVTFNKDVAPIFNARCVSCHREGEIAPFTLTSFDDTSGWEDTIAEVIDEDRMPPWPANPAHGEFSNDARLTIKEKQIIHAWIDGGMPQGEPNDLPSPPVFTDGWSIPMPDQVIPMGTTAFKVPAEGVVDYQHFVVDPKWDTDKYIYAAQARPQNRAVVHHILVYLLPPGATRPDLRRVLVGFAPGSLPIALTDGVAIHVEAGTRLLFEMHYTPNGSAQSDLSDAGVCFMDAADVKKHWMGRLAINSKFRIPPGESHHETFAMYQSQEDEMLISLTPHMHLRGKSFRYDLRNPDGTTEVLLDVPRYDFNWQLKYVLKTPKRLPKGAVVECKAVFDNSASNPSNPDPDREVGWGDQSYDEMMIGFMDTVPADPQP